MYRLALSLGLRIGYRWDIPANRSPEMYRSVASLNLWEGYATDAQRLVARRTVLSGVAGLAMMMPALPGFGQARVENDPSNERNGSMDIKRNGSRPSGKGPD